MAKSLYNVTNTTYCHDKYIIVTKVPCNKTYYNSIGFSYT